MNMCIVHACLPFVVYAAGYQESSQSTQETRSKQQVQPRHYQEQFPHILLLSSQFEPTVKNNKTLSKLMGKQNIQLTPFDH